MKKLIIIAAASFFTFTSCSKIEPTPAPQQNTVSQVKPIPVPPAPAPQKFIITNTETNWGVVEYRLIYIDQNNNVQSIALNMGQSVTLCLNSSDIKTNFTYKMVLLGDC